MRSPRVRSASIAGWRVRITALEIVRPSGAPPTPSRGTSPPVSSGTRRGARRAIRRAARRLRRSDAERRKEQLGVARQEGGQWSSFSPRPQPSAIADSLARNGTSEPSRARCCTRGGNGIVAKSRSESRKHCGGIGASAAQPATDRDPLLDHDLESALASRFPRRTAPPRGRRGSSLPARRASGRTECPRARP